MPNDADGQELLAVVPAVPHEGVGETLSDGALKQVVKGKDLIRNFFPPQDPR